MIIALVLQSYKYKNLDIMGQLSKNIIFHDFWKKQKKWSNALLRSKLHQLSDIICTFGFNKTFII